MKVVAAFVISLNGKITKDDSPLTSSWASAQDQEHFASLLKEYDLIAMGSGTYDAAKSKIQLKEGKRRVVLTSTPEKYKDLAVPGQLEFTKDSPAALVERFSQGGYKRMLMVGGSHVFMQFLQEKLIDELYITIEPKLFGKGKNLLSDVDIEVQLELLSVKKLNKQGTMLMHYKLKK